MDTIKAKRECNAVAEQVNQAEGQVQTHTHFIFTVGDLN